MMVCLSAFKLWDGQWRRRWSCAPATRSNKQPAGIDAGRRYYEAVSARQELSHRCPQDGFVLRVL